MTETETIACCDNGDVQMQLELVAKAGRFRRLIADRAYDADRFRTALREVGATPVIPGRRNRTVPVRHERRRYRERWRIDATIGRLKDFRRVAPLHWPALTPLLIQELRWACRTNGPVSYADPRAVRKVARVERRRWSSRSR